MESAGGLPGISVTTDDQIVLHVDNDCFYAACERLRDPSLHGEPVIVGMGFEPGADGGVVATASYEAREYGIESAQPIAQAMEKLPPRRQSDEEPSGCYRPVDIPWYQEQASQVKDILHQYAGVVREVSIDEAYLDCTDHTSWETVEAYAETLKSEIKTGVGLPVSIGIGPSMSVAKIASDFDKPDGLTIVRPDTVEPFLAPLSVELLHGIGPKTAASLNHDGIETIGDFADRSTDEIKEQYGDRGFELLQRARGIDRRAVTPRGDPKSLSRESAFAEPVTDIDTVEERVQTLAHAVAERARKKGALYQTIGIKVVSPPFSISTREQSLPGPIDDPSIVTDVATKLVEEFDGEPIRKVGVRVANLSFSGGDQSRLATWADGTDTSDATSNMKPSPTTQGQTSLTTYLDPP